MVASGFSMDGPVQAMLDTGANGFIEKPYTAPVTAAVCPPIERMGTTPSY